MERRDLIEDEIRRVSTILNNILARYYGHAVQEQTDAEATNRSLKDELCIDVEKVMAYSYGELKLYVKELKLGGEQLENLSAYLASVGEKEGEGSDAARAWYRRAIDLLEVAEEEDQTLSLARFERKKRLMGLIEG